MVINRSSRPTYLSAFILLSSLLIAVELWVVRSTDFFSHATILSLGITLDIVFGIPLLYYAFVVRKNIMPHSSVVFVGILSVLLAKAVLPAAQHTWLGYIQLAFPLVELVLAGYVIVKTRTLIHAYQQERKKTPYAIDAAEGALSSVLQKKLSLPIHIAVMEVQVLYFSIVGWWKKFSAEGVNGTVISYYRSNGYPAIMAALIMVAAIEIVGVHFLLMQWNKLAAWIASGTSIYSLLWLLGDFHAQRLHPIIVTESDIHIRSGMRWKADIPKTIVLSVKRAISADTQSEGYINAAATGSPSLTLRLATPVLFRGPFGIKKRVSVVGIAADSLPEALAVLNCLHNGKE